MTSSISKAKATVQGGNVGVIGGLPHTYKQILTVEDAESLGNAMSATGNYPPGMDPCFVAGLNGDQHIEDHCIFDAYPECNCQEFLGFVPRDQCEDPSHTDEIHWPNEIQGNRE